MYTANRWYNEVRPLVLFCGTRGLLYTEKEEQSMYQKVPTSLNFVEREKDVEKFWKERHIFEKSIEDRKD